MKRLDGNYRVSLVTEKIESNIKKKIKDSLLSCTLRSGLIDEENIYSFNKWIDNISVESLVILKFYGDKDGYESLADFINNAINEYAEEI